MAALVVGLRLRQLGRTLTRSPWAIVTLVLMGIGALSVLGMLGAAVLALRLAAPDALPGAMVLLSAALVAGWAAGAVVVAGDDSLAPERFSLLPVRPRRLLPAVLLSGAVGVGGIATLLALCIGVAGWSVDAGALAASAATLPVVLVTCVLAGRAVSTALARVLARRRVRDLMLVIVTLLLIASGLLLQAALRGLSALGSTEGALASVAEALAWTPLGAAWGVPLAVAAGEPGIAVARLAIALATVAVLWWIWARGFAARLVAPIATSGGGAVRGGGAIDRLLPASPVGGIAARGIRYRFRDPRHIINVLGCAFVPLIIVGAGLATGAGLGTAIAFAPLVVPLVVTTMVQLDAAYDKDALALHVLTGVRGVDDRTGRLLGMGVLVVPIVVLACVLCAAVAGRIDLLPATLGATLGLTLVVAGIGSAISPWMPGQAPAPEASPFGRGSSGGAEALLGMLAMSLGGAVLAAPALGTAVGALWLPWLGWLSLALGVGGGALVVWAGVVIGGRALDRRWPELLAAVSREG